MRRFVKYNGRTETFRPCDSPRVLTPGRIYVISEIEVMSDQTNYTLLGIEGEFNSVWFDEVMVYLAYTPIKPVLGYPMRLFRMEKKDGDMEPCEVLTSEVQDITEISKDICFAVTYNTVYILQIL